MGDTYILKYSGNKVTQAIENALQIDDKLIEQKTTIDKEIKDVEAIAKGRATGYVFDTVEHMNEWLTDSENTKKLILGDNLYIRKVSVPDYWWDGKSPQILETQKVDLSEYAKKSTSLSGYGITDSYTKEQADNKFQEKLTEEQLQNLNDIPKKEDKRISDLRYYYGTENIVPTPEGYFQYIENEDGTCTINGISQEGLNAQPTEVVYPYEINGLKVVEIRNDSVHLDANNWTGWTFSKATAITIPLSVTKIGEHAFSYTGITDVYIPDSVTEINSTSLFYGCSITSIRLSENLKALRNIFNGAHIEFNTLYVPDSVEFIDNDNPGLCILGCANYVSIPSHTMCSHAAPLYEFSDVVCVIRSGESFVVDGAPCFCDSRNIRLVISNPCKEMNLVNPIFEGNCVDCVIEIPSSVANISGAIFNASCTNPTIICEQGSYADQYAKENGINVKYNISSPTEELIKNKADLSYVHNTFANALKGTASGEAVAITDVSPIEHTLDVKVRSKNIAWNTTCNDVQAGNTSGSVIKFFSQILEKGKTYTLSFDTENTGGLLTLVTYQRPLTMIGSSNATADGTRKSFTFTMTEDFYKDYVVTWVQLRSASTANSGVCSNVQIEEGEVATPYAPYVPDVSAVSLKKYGKNILDVSTPVRLVNCKTSVENNVLSIERRSSVGNQNVYYSLGEFTSFVGKTVTLSIKNDSAYNWTISLVGLTDAASNYGLISLPTGSGIVAGSGKQTTLTYTIPETENAQFFGVRMMSNDNTGNNGDIANFTNCQVELGTVATDYEPYKDPTTYTPNADGTVDGVTSLYPSVTLLTDTGVVIDCEYNRDINKAYEELVHAIISLGGNV